MATALVPNVVPDAPPAAMIDASNRAPIMASSKAYSTVVAADSPLRKEAIFFIVGFRLD